jgi:hypothetical protein
MREALVCSRQNPAADGSAAACLLVDLVLAPLYYIKDPRGAKWRRPLRRHHLPLAPGPRCMNRGLAGKGRRGRERRGPTRIRASSGALLRIGRRRWGDGAGCGGGMRGGRASCGRAIRGKGCMRCEA